MEGTLMGIRSIALSQAYGWKAGAKPGYDTAEAHAPALIDKLLGFAFPPDTLLNVNFPACRPEAVAGVQVTRQGKRKVSELSLDARTDGRGVPYYWIGFRNEDETPAGETDLAALANDFISVTPLKLDLTATAVLGDLKRVLDL
jgi:5'-nucleotidase